MKKRAAVCKDSAFTYNGGMIIPKAIFTPASIAPLCAAWENIERSLNAVRARQRTGDLRGEFSVVANALKSVAHDNDGALMPLYPKKAARLAHETKCAERVQETYNDFLTLHNKQYHSDAIALEGLALVDPEKIRVLPGQMGPADDPIDHALNVVLYRRQYWASAIGLVHYLRSALDAQGTEKLLGKVAQDIEDNYLIPLERHAVQQWMTLLIVGGRPEQLQLAREQLAGRYVSGTYDASVFLHLHPSDSAHLNAEALRQSFARAIQHPRSGQDIAADNLDLGL